MLKKKIEIFRGRCTWLSIIYNATRSVPSWCSPSTSKHRITWPNSSFFNLINFTFQFFYTTLLSLFPVVLLLYTTDHCTKKWNLFRFWSLKIGCNHLFVKNFHLFWILISNHLIIDDCNHLTLKNFRIYRVLVLDHRWLM